MTGKNLGPIRDPGYDPVGLGQIQLGSSLTDVTGFDGLSHSADNRRTSIFPAHSGHSLHLYYK
jgi:hypothetical protein